MNPMRETAIQGRRCRAGRVRRVALFFKEQGVIFFALPPPPREGEETGNIIVVERE
jgi:hypothetical protein